MIETTVGQLAVNSLLPKDMRRYNYTLDKKGIRNLLAEVAEKHPDEYRKVAYNLSRLGYTVSQRTGSNSFGLRHLKKSPAAIKANQDIKAKFLQIYKSDLPDEEKNKRMVNYLLELNETIADKIYDENLQSGNPLAQQVLSGSRGNKFNLRSLVGSDLLYVNHRGRPLPIPVTRSYSEGLTPAQYYAGTFGARAGVIDTKLAVQDAGYLTKQLTQASHRLVVTGMDEDGDGRPDLLRGYPTELSDPDNEGALLAAPVGGYERNTILTPQILADLKAKGVEDLLIRSPAVGGPADGGVYARDLGIRGGGGLAQVGEFPGIATAQALGEPLSQSMLSSKHSGGVAGSNKSVGGFQLINQLVQVPKVFRGGATHAELDGKVKAIRQASQGGHYIDIGTQSHYVPNGYEIKVKAGETVEAGDVLTDGVPNPASIVRHKGIGEGRRYFVKAFRQAYEDSGLPVHRRNVELLSRGLINHVRVLSPFDEYLPDDVVTYSRLEKMYQPREAHFVVQPDKAVGGYLEEPVLHYTIGTRVTPGVAKQLQRYGVKSVVAHKEPPPFEPEMIRAMENVANDPDWMTRFLGSYLQKNFLRGVHRGATSDTAGSSYVPALAQGESFGVAGRTVGPQVSVTVRAPKDEDKKSFLDGLD